MRNLWGDQAEPRGSIRPLLAVLSLLSFIYAGVCWLRLLLYQLGLFKTRRLKAFVISIGNLTVGGTGKTPMVIALAASLKRMGLRVGILSRGYKGQRGQDLQWVSDGCNLLAQPRTVGEEPYLMAWRLVNVPVVVGKDRYRSGQSLMERVSADVILLDDGFQHLGLYRDLNLLMIDGTAPFGPRHSKGRLLPRGTLRESKRGIRRASAVLVSRMEQLNSSQSGWPELVREVQRYNPQAPIFQVYFEPTKLFEVASGKEVDVTSLKGQSVIAFSGIGNPASFRYFLEYLGAIVAKEIIFGDHHAYTREDIERLLGTARKQGIDWLVTTEKDAVKMREFVSPKDRISALRVDLDRIEDPQAWENFISERIKIG